MNTRLMAGVHQKKISSVALLLCHSASTNMQRTFHANCLFIQLAVATKQTTPFYGRSSTLHQFHEATCKYNAAEPRASKNLGSASLGKAGRNFVLRNHPHPPTRAIPARAQCRSVHGLVCKQWAKQVTCKLYTRLGNHLVETKSKNDLFY